MIVAVAGMHRSGTSLVASWLRTGGVVLDHGRTHPPNAGNPKGYFEDRDFVELHARSLRRRSRLTFGWKAAPAAPLFFSASEVEQAQMLVTVRRDTYAHWGWKDPRTTLFLEQWKALIPELKVVIVWRPCAEVAASLARRGLRRQPARLRNRIKVFMDPLSGVLTWRAHNRLACAYQARYPQETLVVAAGQLSGAGEPARAEFARRFGLTLAPIRDLYMPELWHPAPGWLHWLSAALGAAPLERKLQILSADLTRSGTVEAPPP